MFRSLVVTILFSLVCLQSSNASCPDSAFGGGGMGLLPDRPGIRSALVRKPDGVNTVMSMTSLDSLLTLIGPGFGKGEQQILESYLGQSLDQAILSLGQLSRENEGIKIASANGAWVKEGFSLQPEYVSRIQRELGAAIDSMDVTDKQGTADKMNVWGSDHTNGLIPKFMTPDLITPSLVTVLANALYFKGIWEEKFNPKKTKNRPFAAAGKTGQVAEVQVQTMQKTATSIEFGYLAGQPGVMFIRLPFKGKSHSLVMVFASDTFNDHVHGPSTHHVDPKIDVAGIYDHFIANPMPLEQVLWSPQRVSEFTMPKFEIDTSLNDIQDVFKAHGLGPLFQESALSRFAVEAEVVISFILQKARILIDENGGEAAAISAGGVAKTTAIDTTPPPIVKVDGPFAYAIRDEAGGFNLFEGVVRDPR